MGNAKTVQVTQMQLDCYEWENTPATPQPASPFSEDINGSSEQWNSTTTANGRRYFLDEYDEEDFIYDTGSGLLPSAAIIVTKLYNYCLSLRYLTVTPWAVDAFFIALGGVTLATIVIGSMIQQFWSQGRTVVAPMLRQGACAALALMFTNVKSHMSYFLGLLYQGWCWANAPKDVLEFPIQAPADLTFYDQATIKRMIMSIKYEGHDDVDDEDTIMYGSHYPLRNRISITKNRIRTIYRKLTSKDPVDYQ